MPQYALIVGHPPNVCPMTSKAAREAAMKAYSALDDLLKKRNAKLLMDIHLDPDHKAFMLFEAPNAETVRDIFAEAGFLYFANAEMHLVTPTKDLLKMAEKFPTIYP